MDNSRGQFVNKLIAFYKNKLEFFDYYILDKKLNHFNYLEWKLNNSQRYNSIYKEKPFLITIKFIWKQTTIIIWIDSFYS